MEKMLWFELYSGGLLRFSQRANVVIKELNNSYISLFWPSENLTVQIPATYENIRQGEHLNEQPHSYQ